MRAINRLVLALVVCLGFAAPAVAGEPSTLSKLGIDFGAAELGRFAKLGLSDAQKRATLKVVRDQKEEIEKLCGKMTLALGMSENAPAEKKKKDVAISEVVAGFKSVQSEIMEGLHAIITEEQMAKLDAIKKREKRAAMQAKAAAEKRSGR